MSLVGIENIVEIAQELGNVALEKGALIVTAESLTGGGIATAITAVPGASAWFDRAYVTYSVDAKEGMLHVDPSIVEKNSVVSEEVAEAMVSGAIRITHDARQAQSARVLAGVAVTGIAGPGGALQNKPVGTVAFAWGILMQNGVLRRYTATLHFRGTRDDVRHETVLCALKGLKALLEGKNPCEAWDS